MIFDVIRTELRELLEASARADALSASLKPLSAAQRLYVGQVTSVLVQKSPRHLQWSMLMLEMIETLAAEQTEAMQSRFWEAFASGLETAVAQERETKLGAWYDPDANTGPNRDPATSVLEEVAPHAGGN